MARSASALPLSNVALTCIGSRTNPFPSDQGGEQLLRPRDRFRIEVSHENGVGVRAEDPHAAGTGGEGENGKSFSGWQVGRWVAALLVAIGAAAYYLLGVHNQILCHGTLSGKSSVEVCGPPGVSELVPFALLIGVLLAPDLSELGIIGLFSLKKTVENQAERQQNVESKLALVEQRTEVNQSQNASQALSLAVNIAGRQVDAKTVPEWTEQISGEEDEGTAEDIEPPLPSSGDHAAEPASKVNEVEELEPPEPVDHAATTVVPQGELRRALLSQQILYLADAASKYASAAQERRNNPEARITGFSDDEMDRVARWYSVFREEVELVREVRNAVVHRPLTMGDEELEEANRVARKVLRILYGGLGIETTFIDRFEEQLGTGG